MSEVLRPASTEGPQAITVRGSDEAIVLPAEEPRNLLGDKPSFVQFINHSPARGIELRLRRDRSAARRVKP